MPSRVLTVSELRCPRSIGALVSLALSGLGYPRERPGPRQRWELTAILGPTTADTLAPVRSALAAMASLPGAPPLSGLAPELTVAQPHGWVPATSLISGRLLADFLATARQRWQASPHAGAALAWKSYTYWVALPAVVGYAAARRVPLVRPDGVVLRWSTRRPFLTVGLTAVEVAVLPSDPLAAPPAGGTARSAPEPGVRVVDDDAAMLAALRESLMDDHLAPILEQITARLRLGRRTLWGSLASGVAHGLSRAADVVPGSPLDNANELLIALELADLVDLGPRADGRPGLDVQRHTCCLAFTLPEPKICVGCCIR